MVAEADDVVAAYARVAMTGIDRSAAPEAVPKGTPDPVLALLLGRLAVDRLYKNLGIATALATHVLATAVELNEKAACRAVVVTALSASARDWWERLGFHPFDPDEADQLDLDLLTSEIQATLRRVRKGPPDRRRGGAQPPLSRNLRLSSLARRFPCDNKGGYAQQRRIASVIPRLPPPGTADDRERGNPIAHPLDVGMIEAPPIRSRAWGAPRRESDHRSASLVSA